MKLNLRIFDEPEHNTNKTTDSDLADEIKVFYSDYLIDNAEPRLIHDQFAQRCPIPKNGGKTIQFRRFSPLGKKTTALTEGVTPDGQSITVDDVTATVAQYGGYIELSDMLLLTAVDNNLVMATKLLGSQAGRTLDTISREILNGGTNVQYGESAVTARYKLVGGASEGNHYLTVDCIRRAVRSLKKMNADPIDGSFVSIIHPDCAYDLMSDENWLNVKTYSDPKDIYEGEIGKIEGVRFVESTEAKVFHANDLLPVISGSRAAVVRTLTVSAYSALGSAATAECGTGTEYEWTLSDTLFEEDGGSRDSWGDTVGLVGASVLFSDEDGGTQELLEISGVSYSSSKIYTKTAPSATPAQGDVFYPGEAGESGRDVYSTLILGANAYGTTEITVGGLEHIIKQLGSAGTQDPLNQRSSVGWKATKVTARLVEEFMIRIETVSTFESGSN